MADHMIMADGWDAHTDDKGRTYYHNTATGVTTWNFPAAAAAKSVEGVLGGVVGVKSKKSSIIMEAGLKDAALVGGADGSTIIDGSTMADGTVLEPAASADAEAAASEASAAPAAACSRRRASITGLST